MNNIEDIFKIKYDEVISLGFDCTIARMLESYNIRKDAYPIDWTVSRDWNLVTDALINKKTEEFLDIKKKDSFYVNPFNIEFLHHSKLSETEFKEVFQKRFERLFELMNNDKSVLFLRKTHDMNNCSYTNKNFNEIDETIKFCEWLKSKNKKFNFVLFLSCPACHSTVTYKQIDNLYLIKKEESLEKDSFGYYNKDIENFIKRLL